MFSFPVRLDASLLSAAFWKMFSLPRSSMPRSWRRNLSTERSWHHLSAAATLNVGWLRVSVLILMLIVVVEFSAMHFLAYLLCFMGFAWLLSILLTLCDFPRLRPRSPTNDLALKTNSGPLVSVLGHARNEEDR